MSLIDKGGTALESEMPTREFPTGTGLEVCFEGACLYPRYETNNRLQTPRAMFRSVWYAAFIMLSTLSHNYGDVFLWR